ncbi:UNVERIFIED_CONTAM: hypothetical protein Slati_1407200 [Sesamum latifolium]|uniref:Uncharacterized protein n=1 Tax=Sesamum latifolium TaxID=2727402 RepID=A0AAW2X452_9LAMI
MPQKQAKKPHLTKEEHPKVFVSKPPFTERLFKSKKEKEEEKEEKEILETLRKVEVNIPLLNAIKQIPRYARFLKELCTNRSKLKCIRHSQRKLPPKCKDLCMFSIPCKIRKIGIEKSMCDLGASINVMPRTICESLNTGPLKEMDVMIQFVDCFVVYPEGVLEDVLVQVHELIFSIDFYVLDMTEDNSPNFASILLGRPFLKIFKTKLDVDAGIFSMEFDNEVMSFSICGAMQNSNDMHYVFLMDFINPLV